jgi:Domain of unknown function (DUF4440)
MDIRAGNKTSQAHDAVGSRYRPACAVLLLMSLTISPGAAAPADDVRTAFDQFVAAQNAHDIKAVEQTLLSSPEFLWITRSNAVWGTDEALKRFAALYQGTWRLEPQSASLKVIMLGAGVAQVYVPIMFTIGAPGQSAQQTRFLMNQTLVRTQGGWKVSSILPIPAPAQ